MGTFFKALFATLAETYLAKLHLQRDSNVQYPSSPTEPSSAGTERDMINTRKPVRRDSQILMPPPDGTPILFRDHIHLSEVPATPPISAKAKERVEDDIELDLESLGLTDKEIKPEKIQKLEKIGSGGFKEYVSCVFVLAIRRSHSLLCSVFLGKYHGRKVAIAEFRGQLSASE